MSNLIESYQPAIFDMDAFYWDILAQPQAECHLLPDLPAEARMIRVQASYKDTTIWLLDDLRGNIKSFTSYRSLAQAMLEIAGKDKWK